MRRNTAALLEQAAFTVSVDAEARTYYRPKAMAEPTAAVDFPSERDFAVAAFALGEIVVGRSDRDAVLADLRSARVDSMGRGIIVY